MLKRNSSLEEVTDRAKLWDGDNTVTIDYEGLQGWVSLLKAAKGEGYNLKLGSHFFIPGFEERVVGHNVNDDFAIEVTFPKTITQKTLRAQRRHSMSSSIP